MNLNYNVRYKKVTSITDVDFIYYDNGSGVLQQILLSDFKTYIGVPVYNNSILFGGINSPDEDVTILFGGNGVSKNSNTINNG
jgi:hypothetical protein